MYAVNFPPPLPSIYTMSIHSLVLFLLLPRSDNELWLGQATLLLSQDSCWTEITFCWDKTAFCWDKISSCCWIPMWVAARFFLVHLRWH